MKTFTATPKDIEKKWVIIDATDLVLGRMAAEVATILRGKHKPTYTPHMDCGDNVIIINAEKIHLSGKKMDDKQYYRHTGHPGGIRSITPAKVLEGKHPERVVIKAVERMISRNPLGREQMRHLHVFAGNEHPHAAQKPKVIDFASKNVKNTRTRKKKVTK